MKKLVAVVLLFSFPTFANDLVVEGIQKGQAAPVTRRIIDCESAAKQCLASINQSKEVVQNLSNLRGDLVNLYDSELRSKEYWSLLETIGESNV